MNCAKDFVWIRKKAEQEYHLARKEEAERDYTEFCYNTIQLCETEINDRLLSAAQEKIFERNITIDFPIEFSKDYNGNRLFQLVIEEKNVYANGDSSYHAEGQYFSYDALKQYLAKYCLDVSIKENGFKEKSWGSGYRSWSVICVTANPDCED